MNIFEQIKQAQELLNSVVATLTSLGSSTPTWSSPDEDGGRLYSPLFQQRVRCVAGGATQANRALWLFGNTAQLLNVKFMVAMTEVEEEAMMPVWYEIQNKYFPGITSYLYPYPDGIQREWDGGLYPLYCQWYSNQAPMQARETFENNINTQWTDDAVNRWAEQDLAMADQQYYSASDKEKFLEDHPYYIVPE